MLIDSSFRKHKPRKHPGSSAREILHPLTVPNQRTLNNVEALKTTPYVGVTTDGTPIPGLFPLRDAGVETRKLRDAANALLASFDDKQRKESCHPVDSLVWRQWLNAETFAARHGTCLESMSAAQRELALDLLRASLSERGYAEVRKTMMLNEFLREVTEDDDNLGEWLYFLTLFGEPSATQPWGWQIDGHHLIVNCFVLGSQVVMTPVFLGAEPLVADAGPYEGTRIFDDIQEEALEMVRALTPAQQDKAILYPSMLSKDLPPERDHRTEGRQQMGAFRDNAVMAYEGIRADELTGPQRQRLLDLIQLYVGYGKADFVKAKMEEVAAHLDQTYFCWIGKYDGEHPFFYKIQSPVIAIEFDHHRGVFFDNPEAERFHGHVIVRTPNGNDYGKALLKQHQEGKKAAE